ncbi:Protein of unknown function DUF2981 [Babesia duncani]|uniref:Uncharacterized protein n=1 Tax=Babesia duncani TaxID=323732 RepID=A0AAD9PMA4_9APIC|nr:Protein of unknown function DUF2981 [Babesia duncani]
MYYNLYQSPIYNDIARESSFQKGFGHFLFMPCIRLLNFRSISRLVVLRLVLAFAMLVYNFWSFVNTGLVFHCVDAWAFWFGDFFPNTLSTPKSSIFILSFPSRKRRLRRSWNGSLAEFYKNSNVNLSRVPGATILAGPLGTIKGISRQGEDFAVPINASEALGTPPIEAVGDAAKQQSAIGALYDSLPLVPHLSETEGQSEEVSADELPPEVKDLSSEAKSEIVVLYKIQKRPLKFAAAGLLLVTLLFNLYGYWIAVTFLLNKCTCIDEFANHPEQFAPLVD